jgi:Mrp family chromosome partitioning ATPase
MREIAGRLAAVEQRLSTESSRLAEEAVRATEGDYRQALAQERALERSLGVQKQEIQSLRERETAEEGRRGKRGRLEAEMASLHERLDFAAAEPGAPARLQIIQPASAAGVHRGLPLSARLAAGLLIGLALGLGVRRAAEKLDPALTHAPAAEAALGAPILAVLPEVPGGLPPGLLRLESAPPPGAEGPIDPLAAAARGLRDLRTGLLLARGGEPARMVLVTACRRGEGKTTVAAHLALALARRGTRVLLIDGHPQRPRAHRLFGASPGPGLIDVLTGTVKLEEAVRATEESGLFLMPAGDAGGGGAERLDAASLRHLRDRLLQPGRFQHLVIDAGDVGSTAAPERLVVACSATLIVVRAGRNSRSAVRQAAATLRRHGAPHLAGVWIGPEAAARPSRTVEPAPEPMPEAGPLAAHGGGALAPETEGSPALTADVMRRLELLRDRLGRPRENS